MSNIQLIITKHDSLFWNWYKEGDLITVSDWQCDSSVTLKYCPIFMNQPVSKIGLVNAESLNYHSMLVEKMTDTPQRLKRVLSELTQFVTDTFTKEVDKDDDVQYIFSAYFANYILYKYQGDSIDAIYYPSVADNLTFNNIAIKPSTFDKYYKLVKTEESILRTTPTKNHPFYISDGINESREIDYQAGKIIWHSQVHQPFQNIEMYKKIYGYIPE